MLICELLVNGTHPSAVPVNTTATKQVRKLDEKAKEGEVALEKRDCEGTRQNEKKEVLEVYI